MRDEANTFRVPRSAMLKGPQKAQTPADNQPLPSLSILLQPYRLSLSAILDHDEFTSSAVISNNIQARHIAFFIQPSAAVYIFFSSFTLSFSFASAFASPSPSPSLIHFNTDTNSITR